VDIGENHKLSFKISDKPYFDYRGAHENKAIKFAKRTPLGYADQNLEEKLFTTLFPYGKAGYNKHYHKYYPSYINYVHMRLHHICNRFRRNINFILMSFERWRREEIMAYNAAMYYRRARG